MKKSEEHNDKEMLEAEFVILSNDVYHIIVGDVKERLGKMDPEVIFSDWSNWLDREIRKRNLNK